MSNFDDSELDIDLTPPPVGAQYHPAETEDVLLQLRDVIEAARPVPLSASSMIAKDEVLELVDEALAQLPEELRAARWLLKEREEFLARTRHEADEIVDQARARAERMVQRTEVVKAAEQHAYEVEEAAQADARRLRHEVEDFCDQKLASFEIVLERTQKLVAAGRSKLQGANLLAEAAAAAEHGLASGPSPAEQHRAGDDDPDGPDDDGHYEDAAYDENDGFEGAVGRGRRSNRDDEDGDEDGDARARRARPSEGAANGQGRLSVVDRFSELPPPPGGPGSTSDAESTFFDQDLS